MSERELIETYIINLKVKDNIIENLQRENAALKQQLAEVINENGKLTQIKLIIKFWRMAECPVCGVVTKYRQSDETERFCENCQLYTNDSLYINAIISVLKKEAGK